jgi:hypothetical protein
MQYAAERGNVDENVYATAVGKLFLSNRTHVSVNGFVLRWMCLQGERALQAALDQVRTEFSSSTADFPSAYGVVSEFIRNVLPVSVQLGVVLELVEYVYEPLFRHPHCPEGFASVVYRDLMVIGTNIAQKNRPHPVRRTYARMMQESFMKMAAVRIRAAQERAREPMVARPIALTVILVTRQPMITLKREAIDNFKRSLTQ